ncbi:MAG TPA: response regulator [Chthoniobacterales bacterium]|jgi:DNA-binding response OmpR family regulator
MENRYRIPSQNGGRVLVLEPEETVAAKILSALQEAAPEAKVDLARNLEEAQRLVVNARPDLFVLDVDAVPDLGKEFLFDLRTSHPKARAIVLTGVHLAAYREQAAGLGAIHFLEKPFPHGDFVDLVQALLSPSSEPESEKFQGTLSDLHLSDIIQLKCLSGSSAALEFTGPRGEKARVYLERGQVRHATAPGKEGVAAFNEIVNWKGGQISEVSGAGQPARTIDLDWQILLMEAVREMDETRGKQSSAATHGSGGRKILVIDDSLMLLTFVKEILSEANYRVTTAPTAEEGIASASNDVPELILLDYVLPDMKGDEVCQRLSENPATAKVPIVYMSGFGTDLKTNQITDSNVIGSLNKPFTSDLLLETVQDYMPKEPNEPESNPVEPEEPSPAIEPAWLEPEGAEAAESPEPVTSRAEENNEIAAGAGAAGDAWWSAPVSSSSWPEAATAPFTPESNFQPAGSAAEEEALPVEGPFFSGDTSFFSLNAALQTIGKQKLTGILRSFSNREEIELLAENGEIKLVTSRDPELYCPEAPITIVNVDAEQTARARSEQRETGCPFFLTLAEQGLILQEPALQLVDHYGQKLFARLWTARRVRFLFQQETSLPDYARDVPAEADIDYWELTTLRCIQFQELVETPETEGGSIPAYTRDGYERVQNLRLTVAEAQFASQFNGARSIAQIAKNLRLDFKFARLTLFRFLALEIVECWPASAAAGKQERRGFFQRLGFGD